MSNENIGLPGIYSDHLFDVQTIDIIWHNMHNTWNYPNTSLFLYVALIHLPAIWMCFCYIEIAVCIQCNGSLAPNYFYVTYRMWMTCMRSAPSALYIYGLWRIIMVRDRDYRLQVAQICAKWISLWIYANGSTFKLVCCFF